MFEFEIYDNTGKGKRYRVQPGTYSIGKGEQCDIVLDDARVSRHHAQLRIRHGRYVLYDTGSSGGTTVNDRPVTEVVLSAGDVIALAGAQIIFGEDTPTPPEPPVKEQDTLPFGK